LIAHIAEAPDLICMYYVKLREAYDMEGKDPNIMKILMRNASAPDPVTQDTWGTKL